MRSFLQRPHEAFTGRFGTDYAYRLMGACVWATDAEIGPAADQAPAPADPPEARMAPGL